MRWLPLVSYKDPHIALGTISELLRNGSLTLFLGAGVSMSTKDFLNWVDLVRFCLKEKGISVSIEDDEPVDNLLSAMENVRDKCANEKEYKELVQKYLTGFISYDYKHAQNMLLIAIGSLVMSSKRGSIEEIVTYNFDDLLEWYFDFHGFNTQVVSEIPFLTKDSDVTVFHPHGFLPKLDKYKKSTHFIFDKFSYDLTVGNDKYPWFSLCNQLLMNKIALMVGISGNDPAIRTLLTRTHADLSKMGCNRPVAFLLSKHDSIKNDQEYFKRGIIPLGFDSHDDIWTFLLEVCRQASITSSLP